MWSEAPAAGWKESIVGRCVITASLCRTACWDSTMVVSSVTGGLGPSVKVLRWAFYSDVHAGAALLFAINIQLSCPPTQYLIYGL